MVIVSGFGSRRRQPFVIGRVNPPRPVKSPQNTKPQEESPEESPEDEHDRGYSEKPRHYEPKRGE
jgi:hypothetical protein